MPIERAKSSLSAVPSSNDVHESDVCPKCFGSGMEIIPGKGAKVCSCRRQASHSNVLNRARIPRRYENCYITNYHPAKGNNSQYRALKLAEDFVTKYPAIDGGLLFMGSVGVGKTHLAVSILHGLSERGFSCLFYEFGSLLKEIQDSYNANTKASELGVLAPVFNADVLVLDELGAAKPTDWVKDTMAHIINTRYNDRKATIFTTNYPDSRDEVRRETLEDRIEFRLRSRLFEMCKTIEISGEDYRKKMHEERRPGLVG